MCKSAGGWCRGSVMNCMALRVALTQLPVALMENMPTRARVVVPHHGWFQVKMTGKEARSLLTDLATVNSLWCLVIALFKECQAHRLDRPRQHHFWIMFLTHLQSFWVAWADRPAPQTPPELLRAAAFRHSGPSPVRLLRGEPYLQVPLTPAELLSGVGRPAPQTPPELLRAVSAPFRRSGPSPVQLLRGEPYPGLTREMTSLMVDFCLLFLPYMLDMLLLGRNFPNGHSENGRFWSWDYYGFPFFGTVLSWKLM